MRRAGIATLAPMLAAAALVLWGGERLSRRTVEEREPVDRVRLLDFSASLGGELDRLSDLYEGHLQELANTAWITTGNSMQRRCESWIGVRSLTVFGAGGKKGQEYSGARPPVNSGRHVPAVELTDGKDSRATNVISLSKPADAQLGVKGSGWLPGNDGVHRLFWSRPGNGILVAIVIDDIELQACLTRYLKGWAQTPFAPITETQQLATIYGPRRNTMFPVEGTAGPAALLIPHRTGLGEWQVQAWDRLTVRQDREMTTVVLSAGLACVLVLAGVYLNVAQNRALRLAEERVSFVNRVSHELGTPLTNILLNLELAGRGLEERPAETRKRLKLVDDEVRRLARLVANVLTFSRGERRILELRSTWFMPEEALADVLQQFEPSLERAEIRVERSGSMAEAFHGDPDAFSQIVGNLISNVEKYAAQGGWVGVHLGVEDDRMLLRVSDQGPGIPARFRERIFQPFERVSDGLAEGASGTGLGLSIARDLAERMDGRLRLLPSEQGAVFELDLPLQSALKVYQPGSSAA